MRVVIELKRGELPEVVLNNLYKHTQLQMNFGVILLSIVNGQPRELGLLLYRQYIYDGTWFKPPTMGGFGIGLIGTYTDDPRAMPRPRREHGLPGQPGDEGLTLLDPAPGVHVQASHPAGDLRRHLGRLVDDCRELLDGFTRLGRE